MFLKQILLPILLVACLPLILKLLVRLRLGFALLYVVIANTLLIPWVSENTTLSDGILGVILVCTALNWLVTIHTKLTERFGTSSAIGGQERFLTAQLRKARRDGVANEDISIVTVDGLPMVQYK